VLNCSLSVVKATSERLHALDTARVR